MFTSRRICLHVVVLRIPGQDGEDSVGTKGDGDVVSDLPGTLVNVREGAQVPVHQRLHRHVRRPVLVEEWNLLHRRPPPRRTLVDEQLCERKTRVKNQMAGNGKGDRKANRKETDGSKIRH